MLSAARSGRGYPLRVTRAQPDPASPPSLARRLRDAYEVLVREALKFGLVGAVGVVVDVAVFNWLLYGADVLHGRPIRAKIAASAVAILVNYLGSRYWTFRHRRQAPVHHEVALFVFFSLIGVGIQLLCLGISHYVLGLDSQLADNVSANLVGLPLGTLFRFWSYRRFVFGSEALAPAPSMLVPDALDTPSEQGRRRSD